MSKVNRDYAQMVDGTRYMTHGRSGGWVRISLKRHEQKETLHNNGAWRRAGTPARRKA